MTCEAIIYLLNWLRVAKEYLMDFDCREIGIDGTLIDRDTLSFVVVLSFCMNGIGIELPTKQLQTGARKCGNTSLDMQMTAGIVNKPHEGMSEKTF